MTSWLLWAIWAGACLLLIGHGLRRKAGVLQFPFLAGAAMAWWLLPQAVHVLRNPDGVPEGGLIKALVMCLLCTTALYVGWRTRLPRRRIHSVGRLAHPRSSYRIGLLLLAIGLWGYYKLTSLTGGALEFYSVNGAYALEWRGLPVAYTFFAAYLLPGYVITLTAALKLRSLVRALPAAVPVAVNVLTIIFLGRRGVLVGFLLSTACVLYFAKHWLPPRSFVIALSLPVSLFMIVAPYYRTYSQIGADHSRIAQLDLGSQFSGNYGIEFRTMVHLTETADSQRLFQYGMGCYNALIALFVPKLLVGADQKERLFLPVPSPRDQSEYARLVLMQGGVPTGPFSAFEQFWYFGAAWYYLLARAMRFLWERALRGDEWAQTSYAASLMYVVGAVVNDLHTAWVPAVQFVLPLAIVYRLLSSSKRSVAKWSSVSPNITAPVAPLLQHRASRVIIPLGPSWKQ